MSWLGRLRRSVTRSAPAGSGQRPVTPDQDSTIDRIASFHYFFPPHLYFVRSWTGAFGYRADLHTGKDGFLISGIAAANGRDPEFSRLVVDYLIKSHLFRVVVPRPLPPEVPDDPLQVATWSFAVSGDVRWPRELIRPRCRGARERKNEMA